MKTKLLTIKLLAFLLFSVYSAEAAINNYSGNEAGFFEALSNAGLSSTTYDFEDLNVGEIISDQYNPPVSFSARTGYTIQANNDALGTVPHSGAICAEIEIASDQTNSFDITFSEPARGVSFWVLDIYTGINITVYGTNETILSSFNVVPPLDGLYAHIAMLSDSQEIMKVTTESGLGDPFGFADVTVVPEPMTLLVFGFGGLALRKQRA